MITPSAAAAPTGGHRPAQPQGYPGQAAGPAAPPSQPVSGVSRNQTIVYVNQAPSNGMGVAGFVISLIGFLSCGVISPLGLIFSLAGLSKEPRGLAIAGTVIGAIGSLWLLVAVMLVVLGIVAPLAAR